jgi:hypothetical protein
MEGMESARFWRGLRGRLVIERSLGADLFSTEGLKSERMGRR